MKLDGHFVMNVCYRSGKLNTSWLMVGSSFTHRWSASISKLPLAQKLWVAAMFSSVGTPTPVPY